MKRTEYCTCEPEMRDMDGDREKGYFCVTCEKQVDMPDDDGDREYFYDDESKEAYEEFQY